MSYELPNRNRAGARGAPWGRITEMKAVQVGDLMVTIAPVEEIRREAERMSRESAELQASATRHRSDAVARLVEAGMILVAREREWASTEPDAAAQLSAARQAIARVDEVGGVEQDASKPKFGLFGRRRETETPAARDEREQRGAQLRVILAELGRAYGDALGAVRSAHDKAMEMEARAGTDLAEAARLQAQADALQAEAGSRERAASELGFDAPLTAAQLQESGPPSVASPLVLRGNEAAFLAEPAELAREKTYAEPEPASGLAFPVALTGIPYRIGTHRARALPRESLSPLGGGAFVVTNQRLGFVGTLKSFSFPLADLLRVEQYYDGLTLLREGRGNVDVLLSPGASKILFFINYALAQAEPATAG
jgi:hypothetical protein